MNHIKIKNLFICSCTYPMWSVWFAKYTEDSYYAKLIGLTEPETHTHTHQMIRWMSAFTTQGFPAQVLQHHVVPSSLLQLPLPILGTVGRVSEVIYQNLGTEYCTMYCTMFWTTKRIFLMLAAMFMVGYHKGIWVTETVTVLT